MLSTVLQHWPGNEQKPHLIVNAAFGSQESVQHVTDWGGVATFLWNSGNTTWLWEEEEQEGNMPVFTQEGLQTIKVPELCEICKKFNIKQGKKKANIISNILCCSETVHQH